MHIDSYHSISQPSLFSARTRKRHRDNRPTESDVHRMRPSFPSAQSLALIPSAEHTLSLLYSAQQTPQSQFQTPAPFQPQPVESLPASNQSTQQSTLHSFWAIPSSLRQSSPSSNASSSANTPSTTSAINAFFQATHCENCNSSLNPSVDAGGDAMDVDMMVDIDMDGGSHRCTGCGKQVCQSCSVSNLGADKKCLHCAGPKAWIGGVGWCDQD